MLVGIFLIALSGFFGALTHRRTRLEKKLLKNIPLNDWLTITVFPVLTFLGFWLLVSSILSRPAVRLLPFDDLDVLGTTIFFVVLAFGGSVLHFSAKIMWRYLEKDEENLVYQINEMFHNRLSHYLVYVSVSLAAFNLMILEINHPLPRGHWDRGFYLALTGGAIAGWSLGRAAIYAHESFGGYSRPLFLIVLSLLLFQEGLFRYYRISLRDYPVSLSIFSVWGSFVLVFLLRKLVLFSKLDNRLKSRFIKKIFSV